MFSDEISHDSLYLALVQTRALRDLGDMHTLSGLLAQEVCNLCETTTLKQAGSVTLLIFECCVLRPEESQ